MESMLLNKYRTLEIALRQQMIDDAKNYIGDATILKLIEGLDVSDIDSLHSGYDDNIYYLCHKLRNEYADYPRLRAEISTWLTKH